jgi:putative flippase GtrA
MRSFAPAQRAEFWQLMRYGATAGSVALFYLALVALGIALGWWYFFAILAAQVVTIGVAFPVYRTFVFRSHGKLAHDFVRFISVWASGAIAGIVATPVLVEFARIPPLVAQVFAIVVVSIGTFLLHRLFSFRKPRGPAHPATEEHDPAQLGREGNP